MFAHLSLPDKPASENPHDFIIVALPAAKAIIINEVCKSKVNEARCTSLYIPGLFLCCKT